MADRSVAHDDRPSWSTLIASVSFGLRSALGTSVVTLGCNVVGALVVGLVIVTVNTTSTHAQRTAMEHFGVVLIVASVVVAVVTAVLMQRRTLRWLIRRLPPTAADSHRLLRLPSQMAVLTTVVWTVDAIVFAVNAHAHGVPVSMCMTFAAGIMLAGLTSAALTSLVLLVASRPMLQVALRSHAPVDRLALSVRGRLLLTWLLTSGAPLLGVLLILTQRDPSRLRAAIGIAVCLALSVGLFATVMLSRALGNPLRRITSVVRAVGTGDLSVFVPVAEPGEIGQLESGINEMVAGLRERDRVQDMFGRHVGPAVAAEALRRGVTLSGEVRHVVALFVDITGSTALTRRLEPQTFVAMLNRFFDIVVTEVERNGGLVNKFEGDAALCVFGAPVELIDTATAALATARRIRDGVLALGELSVGIGVAAGPVVAGQIGAASRLEYTVIGDAVNEAARLTDLAKGTESSVMASEEVIRRASPAERELWHSNGEVTLRGRGVPTVVWTV